MSSPQAEEPFSAKSLAYIKALDIAADVRLLEKTLNFRPICLRNMRIAGTLLQMGACEFGLNLAEIGKILCRSDNDEETPSMLE